MGNEKSTDAKVSKQQQENTIINEKPAQKKSSKNSQNIRVHTDLKLNGKVDNDNEVAPSPINKEQAARNKSYASAVSQTGTHAADLSNDQTKPNQDVIQSSITEPGNNNTDDGDGTTPNDTAEEEEKKEAVRKKISKVEMVDQTSYYFLNPLNLDPEEDRDVVSVLALSDTFCTHSMEMMEDIPPVDILIHAGNFTRDGTLEQVQDFNLWLNQMLDAKKCRYALVIAGNHDVGFDASMEDRTSELENDEPNDAQNDDQITAEGVPDKVENANAKQDEADQEGMPKEAKMTTGGSEAEVAYTDKAKECRHSIKNAIYLEDQGIEILGLKLYGTPWSRLYDDKAKEHRAFCVGTEDELKKCYHNIPYDVDIMVSHYPPYLHNDNVNGENVGSKMLIEKLYMDAEPKCCIFGHVTTCHGTTMQERMETAFMNVNCSNEESEVAKKPILFYLQPKLESFF